jgi:hypothetical protein
VSRKEKLIKRLLGRPKDFTYDELVSLLGYFEYFELKKGKTGGSRRAFVQQETRHVIRLHKPHPKNVLKRYQIDEIIDHLTNNGLL